MREVSITEIATACIKAGAKLSENDKADIENTATNVAVDVLHDQFSRPIRKTENYYPRSNRLAFNEVI